jgi:hypothetical protein
VGDHAREDALEYSALAKAPDILVRVLCATLEAIFQRLLEGARGRLPASGHAAPLRASGDRSASVNIPSRMPSATALRDGRIGYVLKVPRKGRTHRVMTPVEFMARLAAFDSDGLGMHLVRSTSGGSRAAGGERVAAGDELGRRRARGRQHWRALDARWPTSDCRCVAAPRTKKAKVSTPTAAEVPVTRAMLGRVRAEVLARIDQAREEASADFHRLDAKIDGVRASVARIELLVEEQNARNQVVLDGITALLSRQNQVELRVTQVEETVRQLASA